MKAISSQSSGDACRSRNVLPPPPRRELQLGERVDGSGVRLDERADVADHDVGARLREELG